MSSWEPVLIPIVIDAIAVVGLYVILNSGRLSAGHAAFVAIGMYAAAWTGTRASLSLWMLAAVSLLVAAAIGAVLAAIIEPLETWFFAIATLAFGVVLGGLVSNIEALGGALGLYGTAQEVSLTTALLGLGGAVALVLGFDRSRFGMYTRAVRDDPLAATSLGIGVRTMHTVAFALGCGVAGLSGALRVNYFALAQPADTSFQRSLLLLVFLTVGGSRHIGGAIAGTVVLGVLPELLRPVGTYRLEFYGLLVVLVMVFRPNGLMPSPRAMGTWAKDVRGRVRDRAMPAAR